MNWIECARPLRGTLKADPLADEQDKRVNEWLAKHAPEEWKTIRARMGIKEPSEDECKALEASMVARDAGGEWEEVPPEQWKIGDVVEAVRDGVNAKIVKGKSFEISDLSPTSENGLGINVKEIPSKTCYGWPRSMFRLRRRKTKEFVWYPKWAIAGQGVRIKTASGHIMNAKITLAQPGCFSAGGFYFEPDGKARFNKSSVIAEIIGLID